MKLKIQIEYYLEKNNMNASQLARKAKVPRQTIANWLMGQSPKNIDQVKRVADLFRVSLDHLLYGDGKMQTDLVSELKSKRFEIRFIREIDGDL